MEANHVGEMYPVHGTGEKRRGWFFDFYNQWPGVLRPRDHSWQDWTLTLIQLTGENSPYKRSWELEVTLIGFNLRVTYVYRDTDEPSPSAGTSNGGSVGG